MNRCGQSKTLREFPLLRPPRNKTRGGFLFYSINKNIVMVIKNNNYGFVSLNGFLKPKYFYTMGFRAMCSKDSYGETSTGYKEEYADEFILSIKRN